MIVRIHGSGQYRLSEEQHAALQVIDSDLVRATQSGDAQTAHEALGRAVAYVQEHGMCLPATDLSPSDIILPAADASFEETQSFLQEHDLLRS